MASVASLYYVRNEIFTKRERARPLNLSRDRSKAGSAGPASELMGVTFYLHLKPRLNEVFADEPEALAHLQQLLEVITLDELSHIGQRRNHLGAIAIRVARRLLSPMIRSYFADIPESKLLFNIDKMVQDARQFDYNVLPPRILERIWIPSYILAARSA